MRALEISSSVPESLWHWSFQNHPRVHHDIMRLIFLRRLHRSQFLGTLIFLFIAGAAVVLTVNVCPSFWVPYALLPWPLGVLIVLHRSGIRLRRIMGDIDHLLAQDISQWAAICQELDEKFGQAPWKPKPGESMYPITVQFPSPDE